MQAKIIAIKKNFKNKLAILIIMILLQRIHMYVYVYLQVHINFPRITAKVFITSYTNWKKTTK